jgi:putative signal transducing protein
VIRLIETTDRSVVESLRLAFEAEGIDLQVLESGAGSLPFVPVVVNLVHDEDAKRAHELLSTFQRPALRYSPSRPLRHARLMVILVLLALSVLYVCWP